ncbi:hypothetical protein K435DRAFT_803128 [Dendrothele bispora CBS 962.96]|uniref:Uncharacterized protein n=1 Tax=Dendrothele bispora (strain CBS 962.96) TaxID=1314807 RepID=A0A4S8LBA9_DENBC|nr:hypothetical protein K435DRAFT_924089 [Dendrothele bispora CBS 962.96]THU88967.1 hypothetical protein K435DRAFT_803128 [Dendrothele bispora CBS 962.96]
MAEPISVAANVAQIGQLAFSASSAYAKAKKTRDGHRDIVDVAVQSIDETMSALFKYSLYRQVSSEVIQRFDLFETDFLELNSRFEDAFAEQKLHARILQMLWLQEKPVEDLNRRMKELHVRIVSASADAVQMYRRVVRDVQADYKDELDDRMLRLFAKKGSTMSIDEFIDQVVRRPATAILPAEELEIYLNLLTQKFKAIAEVDEKEEEKEQEEERVKGHWQTQVLTTASTPIIANKAKVNPFADPIRNPSMDDVSGRGTKSKQNIKMSVLKRE